MHNTGFDSTTRTLNRESFLDGDGPFFSGRLAVEDLSALAKAGILTPAIFGANDGAEAAGAHWSRIFDQMARGLFRRNARHVLVTGQPRVGKTTLVRELARQAVAGRIPFLQEKRFLRVDCQDLPPHESRRCFETLLAAFGDADEAVLCLDSLETLLCTDGGPSNKPLLRQAMRHPHLRIIGILSQWDFDELLANDAALLDLCTVIHVPEPDEDFALAIVRKAAGRLEADFGLAIPPKAIDDAVRLSSKYIWNQRLPRKAIRILERACEALDYERTQLGRAAQAISCEGKIGAIHDCARRNRLLN